MKRIVSLVFFLALVSCASNRNPAELADTDSGFKIVIERGKHFSNLGWFGPFPFLKGPQMAIWTETSDGTFLKTLFVTGRSSRNDWIGADKRPDALPVWSNRKALKEDTDAVSAPTDSLGKSSPFKVEVGTASQIYLEVNLSYDWNRTWSRNLPKTNASFNGENGQPSLIYTVLLDPDNKRDFADFQLIGHGSPSGSDGKIDSDLSGIDTAKDILRSVRIERIRL
jgi:hypothetical protein